MRFQIRTGIGISLAAGLLGGVIVARSAEDAVFSSEVAVVNVLASVRDKQGGLVADLEKEDFILNENGEKQTIRYFARQSDLPLTIGLLVDTSLSQRNLLPAERAAGRRFFEQVLRPNKDLAFVLAFDYHATLYQDLTGSLRELEDALGGLETPPPPVYRRRFAGSGFQFPFPVPGGTGQGQGGRGGSTNNGGWGGQRPSSRGGGRGVGTVMYDSVYLAAKDVLANRTGRKAVILISDGVDLGSKIDIEGAVEAALRSETAVYSIRYYDRAAYGGRGVIMLGGPNGKGPLRKLSEKTGGAMFEVSNKLSLDDIFARIEEELRSQYSIGYTPTEGAEPGEFREIRLRTKNKKLKVFTRDGYYAGGS